MIDPVMTAISDCFQNTCCGHKVLKRQVMSSGTMMLELVELIDPLNKPYFLRSCIHV